MEERELEMKKFGEGLNIEFAKAVRAGQIKEPFSKDDVEKFAELKGWKPSRHYINVMLANSSSQSHSLTYRKIFTAIGNGQYILSELGRKTVL